MANFSELREKETEEFISKTLTGLKAIKREVRQAIISLKELEEKTERGGRHE